MRRCRAWPHYFLLAETPDDELRRHQAEAYAEETAKVAPLARQTTHEHVQVLEPPEPVRDEDAVVAIRRTGLTAAVNAPAIDPQASFEASSRVRS